MLEGRVQQALVLAALVIFEGGSTRPRWLADSPQRATVMSVGELLPRADDRAGVAPDLAHVLETDLRGIGTQPLGEQGDLPMVNGDQDRAVGCDPLADERHEPVGELALAAIDERPVPEAAHRAVPSAQSQMSITRVRTGGTLRRIRRPLPSSPAHAWRSSRQPATSTNVRPEQSTLASPSRS